MDKKTRVLIVDDDPRNIRILYEILGGDFKLTSAENGEQALEVVDISAPDIILLDIMMPGIDGYEVCERLESSDNHKNIKIILVSGKAMTEERVKGYESGADDFVSKPFDMDEIHAKVTVFAKLKSMEEVNKLKCDFLSLISHEMGTPLNHIIGISDLLLNEEKMDETVQASISDIGGAAKKLSTKISKILYLAKLNQIPLGEKIHLNVNNLLSDVVQLIGQPPRDLDITLDIDESINIDGDYELIQKMFFYLLDVAIKQSETTVLCQSEISMNEEAVSGISISIIDTREALSELQINNYFDPFYIEDLMLHNEGLNIAMAICAQIAAMHGGSINIDNNSNNGTTVLIWFPCKL